MTDRAQRFTQAHALFARQPLDQNLVIWRAPVMDIGDLLGENEIKEFGMYARKRVEIETTTTSEGQRSPKAGPASIARAGDDELRVHARS